MKCPCCGHESDFICFQMHHKFHKTAKNLKRYPDYINRENNLQKACWNCNPGHRSDKLIHLSETEFCEMNNIRPRSKEGKAIYARKN